MPPEIQRLGSPEQPGNTEITTPLIRGSRFEAEHIASYGASSPPDFWYDQEQDEWVALLTGTATLQFEDGIAHLKAGDCLTIPAHLKHRVSATSRDATWLALHFEANFPSGI